MESTLKLLISDVIILVELSFQFKLILLEIISSVEISYNSV